MAKIATSSRIQLTVTASEDGKGLEIERYFTEPGKDPFDQVEWETRDARIGHGNEIAFEQKGVEFPKSWSQNAANIVAQKYFRGQQGTEERECSARQMIGRVADRITEKGDEQGYFATAEDRDTFKGELTHILLHQMASFNSPVWFNVGFARESKEQCSACQPYHALISTPDGMVPIGKLVDQDMVGHEVYDSQGVTRVVATKANGRKSVRRIVLRNGSFIEATPDHVVKAVAKRGSQPQWLQVDQLVPGMRLHLHPHRSRQLQPAFVTAGHGSSAAFEATEVELELLADDGDTQLAAEAAIAGWLQADGFVGQYEKGTNRSLTLEFQVATDDEFRWVTEQLNIALPEIHRKVREVPTKDTSLRYRRIRLYGEQLRDFVDRWELLARGTEIRVPSRLWTASHLEIANYLRSIFQADGYVSIQHSDQGYENARIGFAVIGERWVEDVQILLNVLGIYSRRICKRDRRSNRHDLHEVSVSIGSERARFAELVGFIGTNKHRRLLDSLKLRGLRHCSDLREEEIIRIEDAIVQDVYDIQTESGEYLSNNIAVHNCFILSVDDTMESILNWNTEEGLIFRGGSGSGINLSKIRGSQERLSRAGFASGPVSFMRGTDSWAGTIKSGGTTRRAAKMVVLDIDHPDIKDFIWCKAKEEEKARALSKAGFDMSIGGEGYVSIQYQNANNSVRVTDEFMKTVERGDEWQTVARKTGEPVGSYDAGELMHEIANAAWRCADPGLQYDTTINDWHTCPNSGRINASNPCSEYMHVDNSACNLSSINLMKFEREDGTFNISSFKHTVNVMLMAQEIMIDFSSYPTEGIGDNARAFRQLGLGYANLGALLMSRGVPYDSDEGRTVAAAITSLMTGEAYRSSAEFAAAMGPYDAYEVNRDPHMNIMRKHRDAAHGITKPDVDTAEADESSPYPSNGATASLIDAARTVWDDAVSAGEKSGYRNSQATVLAPTGTISFMMDCDTTGIEPDFSLVKVKDLAGGGQMTIVNRTVPLALSNLGYSEGEIEQIEAHINEHRTIVGAPSLKDEHLAVFDVAVGERAISHMGHIKMMAAVQPFISGAISKTVNMPNESTVEDIQDAYTQGWKLGLKALAIYRDGSKTTQALRTEKKDENDEDPSDSDSPANAVQSSTPDPTAGESDEPRLARRRLPRERQSITHKFSIAGHEGYITAGMYEDGSLGEIFLTDIGKDGSTLRGMMNAFATSISVGLQYGVPLETFVRKFSYMRFDPEGITGNPEIPFAKSLPDYIMRWLASRFLDADTQEELGIMTPDVRERKLNEESGLLPEHGNGSGNGDTNGSSNDGSNGSQQSNEPSSTSSAKIEPNPTNASDVQPAASAMTDAPPVTPAKLLGGDVGPACSTCGGIMQRTGSCYTCASCGANTGCG